MAAGLPPALAARRGGLIAPRPLDIDPTRLAPAVAAAGEFDRAPADLRTEIAALARERRRPATAALRYLRLLYELQDFAAFQRETRTYAARIASGRVRKLSVRAAEMMLRLAETAIVPADELADLLAAVADGAPDDAAFSRAVVATRRRLLVRRRLAARYEGDFTLITLGLHCLPWLLPNRWGLRTPGQFAATHNPFALAKHRYAALLDDLANDFADYAPAETLMPVTTPSGIPIAARYDRGAIWNHHKGEFWAQDGFVELRRSLGEGLAAFRASAADPTPVFLLGDVPFRYPEQPIDRLDALHGSLDRLTGGRHRLLLASQRATPHGRAIIPIDTRTSFLYVPYPDPAYRWSDEATSNSVEGLRYERGYVASIYAALLDWGVVRRRER